MINRILLSIIFSFCLVGSIEPVRASDSCGVNLNSSLKRFLENRTEYVNCIVINGDPLPSPPLNVAGFNHIPNTDYWEGEFKKNGQLELGSLNKMIEVRNCQLGESDCSRFPQTMNDCGSGFFIMLWKSEKIGTRVAVGLSYGSDYYNVAEGSQGYVIGTNCHKPAFKQIDGGDFAKINYAILFWGGGSDSKEDIYPQALYRWTTYYQRNKNCDLIIEKYRNLVCAQNDQSQGTQITD